MPLGLGSKEGVWPLSRTCDSFVCRAQETLDRLPGGCCCIAKQRKVFSPPASELLQYKLQAGHLKSEFTELGPIEGGGP